MDQPQYSTLMEALALCQTLVTPAASNWSGP